MKNILLMLLFMLLLFAQLNGQAINEIDSDQGVTDNAEFIELLGTANSSLDGYVLVLVQGNNDKVYFCQDLDGYSFDANGFFTIGNAAGVNLTVTPSVDWLNDGTDAVALYQMATCPTSNTKCSDIVGTLVSAVVYGLSADSGLTDCYPGPVYNEAALGNSAGHSLQFDGLGGWDPAPPTMGASNSGSLPIALTSFEANPMENKSIKLTWQTSSEENNEYFSIEHSTDGTNFREVGKETGAGTTTEAQTYDFMHEGIGNGLHYYRLKQVDFDGAYEYTNIVTASLRNGDDAVFVMPNPTSNEITIQPNTPFEKNTDFQILNMQGQVVLASVLQEGAANLELNISGFPVGIYYLRLLVGNEVVMKKIIKQ